MPPRALCAEISCARRTRCSGVRAYALQDRVAIHVRDEPPDAAPSITEYLYFVDGRWREIDVRLKDRGGRRERVRVGYRAPTAP